ncbi:MAG: MFS transporter [FCB group bacterium]|nr:MFS transporter [FCB group bacterium]
MPAWLNKFFGMRFGAFDRRIYILAFGWLVTAAGFAMVIPFMSIYFYQELGLSMFSIGLFFGFTAVLRTVPQPFAGWLSDRLGRVPIMGWSQILRAFTFAGVGLAIFQDAGFWTIAAIISLNYILGAVLHPSANAMVADLVTKDQRIPAYSLLRIAGNLGWAIGPMMGGFIAHRSYGVLFLAAGAMALLSGLYFLLMLKDNPKSGADNNQEFKFKNIIKIGRDKILLRHCLISFILFLVVAQFIAPLSVYGVEHIGINRAQLGWLYTLNGAMVVFMQYFISYLLRNSKLTNQMALSGVIYAGAYLIIGWAAGMELLIIGMVILTTAEMINSPPSVTLVANLSPPEKYGQYMGMYGLFQMAGFSLGPTLGGFLFDIFKWRPSLMWTVVAALAVISALLYLYFGKQLSPEVNNGCRGDEVSHA